MARCEMNQTLSESISLPLKRHPFS
uniref:Uncharacterized protein n=2 Tax=Onchocerca ochengi TaxID=42157 RepID=A0A182EMC4_ONCOC